MTKCYLALKSRSLAESGLPRSPERIFSHSLQRADNVSDGYSPVQHFGTGPLQFLQDLRELGIIITSRTPA